MRYPILLSFYLLLLPATGSSQTLDERECNLAAQEFHNQKRSQLEPTKEQLTASLNTLGGTAMLYSPLRSFDMAWGLGGGHSSFVKQCLERKSIEAERAKNAQKATQLKSIDARSANASAERGSSIADGLNNLSKLYSEGLLNEEEFSAAKRRLLGL